MSVILNARAYMRARVSLLLVLALGLRLNQAANDFDFDCVSNKTLESFEGDNDSLYYLDRQTVDCGPGSVLASFQLKRGASSSIYYEYTCCKGSWVDNRAIAKDYTTQFQDATKHFYLDRNKVVCDAGYSLNKFHLKRGAQGSNLENQFQYEYTCLKTSVNNCIDLYGNYDSYGNSIVYLDRLTANCADNPGGSHSVMSSWLVEEKGNKWRYVYSCCLARTMSPSSSLNYATIKLQSQGKCVTWSNTKTQDYYPVSMGDCGATSNNLWYVQPPDPGNWLGGNDNTFLRLYPYPPLPDSTFYLQDQSQNAGSAAVGVSAPRPSSGVLINEAIERVTFSDGWLMGVFNGDSVVATRTFIPGPNYNYLFQARPTVSALTIPNMGAICSNLDKFGWKQPQCPFPAVTGTGGRDWSSNLQYIGAADLAGLVYSSSFTFFFGNGVGTVGGGAGTNSLLGGFRIGYNDGTQTTAYSGNVDLASLSTATCTLGLLEYLVSLQILPESTGPLDARGVAGLKWVTNTGKVCSVPPSIENDPIWSSIPTLAAGSGLGSGMPYGAVVGFKPDGYIGSLGFINYETLQGTLSLPSWSVTAANSAMTATEPTQLTTTSCSSAGGVATSCKMSFTISQATQSTFTQAYTTSNARMNSQTRGYTQSVTISAELGFKIPFLASTKQGLEVTAGFNQQSVDSTTLTQSDTNTTAVANTGTVSATCETSVTMEPDRYLVIGAYQTNGKFTIPWSGTYSYLLNGGAVFSFDASGSYSANMQSACFFDLTWTNTTNTPPSARSLSNVCKSQDSCSRITSGKEVKQCECPPGTKCIPVRFGGRVDNVCRRPEVPKNNQAARATTITLNGARCNKWHRVDERHLSLDYVAKDCNVPMLCLEQANSDFLKVYRDRSSPRRLLPKALGKYLDIGCFYPSRRPQFAKF